MRQARLKFDGQSAWYHCYNRVVGTAQDRPFGPLEKEQFVRLLHRVHRLYAIRIVAYQVMSNHFHLLVQAPAHEPDADEMCRRYAAFHGGRRTLDPDSEACRIWQARSRDISWLLRHLQHLFTAWYNRTRSIRRRGPLWADRFKNTLLESGRAVWACWAYIEYNPVRAEMVPAVSQYRFCSHGVWGQSGRHPFAEDVASAALPMLKDVLGVADLPSIQKAMDEALSEPPSAEGLAIARRARYWTRGLAIGSQLFVREVMTRSKGKAWAMTHGVALRGPSMDEAMSLHAWRWPRRIE
jgi:REP element-mobilizing transposase RayT